MTAQQLADHVGVSRASVIRTAQTLGYSGFPQLRVALAQEAASARAATAFDPATGSMLDMVQHNVAQFSHRLEASFGAIDDTALAETVRLLDAADRVLVVANGFSAPLGLDLAQRLISAGRSAEFHTDAMAQRIAAHHLGAQSVCFVFSGSGANRPTLEAAERARESGAAVIAMTNFASSPLTQLATVVLLLPPANNSFQDELIHTSRAALMVLTEQIVELLLAYRGERGAEARGVVLSLLGDAIES